MKTLARLVALPLLLALALAAPAVAQTPVPPQTMPVSSSTQVIGTIVNRTEGGAAPDRLDLVLHAWDADLNERLMLDGQSSPDGTFRFEDVPVEPELLYSVMATYEGVSYFSEPVGAIEGEDLPPFEVPIYETTTDTSQIQIERMHVMFLASHAGLEVAEVYSLSNLGDRAVKAAVSAGRWHTGDIRVSVAHWRNQRDVLSGRQQSIRAHTRRLCRHRLSAARCGLGPDHGELRPAVYAGKDL